MLAKRAKAALRAQMSARGVGRVAGLANNLNAIVRIHGSTDKGQHGYLPYYKRHLGLMRLRRLTVFEVGVGGYEDIRPGGSLAVWRDYFMNSQIVGIDISEKKVSLGPRVSFARADQSSESDLLKVVSRHGAPDIVIDDGSHIGSHIWTTFRCLWPLMVSGSIYVVEDLSTSYYPDWGGGNPAPRETGVGLLNELTDSVQANDPVFQYWPELGSREAAEFDGVAAVHAYPGIAFIEKL